MDVEGEVSGSPTKRQAEVLDFIRAYIAEHKRSPGLREIGDAMGLRSLATIHRHVRGLREKGLVTWRWGCSNTIQVIGACPACGRSECIENQAKSA